MAKNVYVKPTEPQAPIIVEKETPAKKSKEIRRSVQKSKDYAQETDEKTKEKWIYLFGVTLLFFSFFLLVSFTSHLFVWYRDFDKLSLLSPLSVFTDTHIAVDNITGRMGAFISFFFINRGFGIASFLFVSFLSLVGFRLLNLRSRPLLKAFFYHSFFLVWLSLLLGSIFRTSYLSILGGAFGYELSTYLDGLVGFSGLYLILLFSLICFTLFAYNFKWKTYPAFLQKKTPAKNIENETKSEETTIGDLLENSVITDTEKKTKEDDTFLTPFVIESNPQKNKIKDIETLVKTPPEDEFENTNELSTISESIQDKTEKNTQKKDKDEDILFTIESVPAEKPTQINSQKEGVEDKPHFGINTPYDPALDLKGYKFPTRDLLVDFGDMSKQTMVQNEELLANKNRIIETLKNYAIEISQIKATIGPTVTLYEIVPAPGVRISKIKNLEDDIALSLSALGIRIIAPIPGKGTIGIEVPNQNKQVVPMRVMLEAEKFKNGDFDLPIALGKTISNECFVTDLSKMPHLLMAGATGQGKSVGLNAIIGSLLYKKHPSELKFVMVDPKKVELSLFNKIERHYLAKLPDSEEAIITDTRKVVRTLNSLCIEMDQRYDLLKDAQVKNIKEYNQKFISRRLNPEEGHRFLPYIVLIVDEFADLIMTAGKEVELPIARLAQLARAIGIHLVIATQRPSVNIITGTIKANFPARVAFRVTSKIDSRTILDASGADQLIGRGDMLLSTGNEMHRLQCAFIDTPEIERITEFIGSQRGYPSAYLLPECPDETSEGGSKDLAFDDRDPLFEEAARLIVASQQGSTSLIQRKLKLGYNRAGRLIDQLEAAGIVGSFEGSKSREVKIKDPVALEQILNAPVNDII